MGCTDYVIMVSRKAPAGSQSTKCIRREEPLQTYCTYHSMAGPVRPDPVTRLHIKDGIVKWEVGEFARQGPARAIHGNLRFAIISVAPCACFEFARQGPDLRPCRGDIVRIIARTTRPCREFARKGLTAFGALLRSLLARQGLTALLRLLLARQGLMYTSPRQGLTRRDKALPTVRPGEPSARTRKKPLVRPYKAPASRPMGIMGIDTHNTHRRLVGPYNHASHKVKPAPQVPELPKLDQPEWPGTCDAGFTL